MKTAIYPGSFNPWHQGHHDILKKALQVFDKVIVCYMLNPEKFPKDLHIGLQLRENDLFLKGLRDAVYKNFLASELIKIEVSSYGGLLVDAVRQFGCDAVVRGLRNGSDLQYEQNQMYWNEDLGLEVPVTFFLADRTLAHISSSAIRSLRPFKMKKVGAGSGARTHD